MVAVKHGPRIVRIGEIPEGKLKKRSVRFHLDTLEVLRVHAFQRKVSLDAFITDLLNGWLEAATDYRQQIYRDTVGGIRAPEVPERWPGYRSTLGYAPVAQDSPFGEVGPSEGTVSVQRGRDGWLER